MLGSTGKTGGWVLEEALAAGFHVRALVRDPRKLEAQAKEHAGTLVLGEWIDGAVVQGGGLFSRCTLIHVAGLQ